MKQITFQDFRYQGREIDALYQQIEQRKLVHALLITGEPGTGKRTLATLISQALMCETGKGIPCGKCKGCRLVLNEDHPDITIIKKGVPLSQDTAKGRSTIPVDDIREMERLCHQYAYEGGNRVVIIYDAETMTVQAQNSLLKFLEEPPQNVYFLLTSAHPEQLLTTVKSRCRPVKLIPWETTYIQKVLEDAGISTEKSTKAAICASGSIGNALRIAADERYWIMCEDVMNTFFRNRRRSNILSLSSGWKDRKTESDMLFSILEDSIRFLMNYRLFHDQKHIPKEYPDEWQNFASYAPVGRFVELMDRIREARKQTAYNVNFQAVIEQLLIAFTGESEKWIK